MASAHCSALTTWPVTNSLSLDAVVEERHLKEFSLVNMVTWPVLLHSLQRSLVIFGHLEYIGHTCGSWRSCRAVALLHSKPRGGVSCLAQVPFAECLAFFSTNVRCSLVGLGGDCDVFTPPFYLFRSENTLQSLRKMHISVNGVPAKQAPSCGYRRAGWLLRTCKTAMIFTTVILRLHSCFTGMAHTYLHCTELDYAIKSIPGVQL